MYILYTIYIICIYTHHTVHYMYAFVFFSDKPISPMETIEINRNMIFKLPGLSSRSDGDWTLLRYTPDASH